MIEPFVKEEKEYFIIKKWNDLNAKVIAGFTTKQGGYSTNYCGTFNCGFHIGDQLDHVLLNRSKLADALGFPLDLWIGAEQTHDVHIAKINQSDKGKGSQDYESSIMNTDGLYTSSENVLLTLCFADCVPLFFFAPQQKIVGIAHAGWKGTVKGIARNMVKAWNNEGIKKEEIKVVIGPSICKQCYIVDNRVIDEVNHWIENEDEKPYIEISTGQFQLDLRKLNQVILEKTGIKPENIDITQLCTSCNHDDFFSHRRDKGNTGRMLSFIGLKGV